MTPPQFHRRRVLAAAGALLTSPWVQAAWPNETRPVRILVPWPTGGATDQIVRDSGAPKE